MNDKYTKKLENVIKQMLRPLKDIPFGLVIESICNKKVIPFDKRNKKDAELLTDLVRVANQSAKRVNKVGIRRSRANEVGNDMEPFVIKALNGIGCKADIPIAKSGKKRSMGYPDIEFIDKSDRTNYLECKTYNIKNVDTKQRSFYLSPSDDFKITKNAHHFVISFEVYVSGRRSKKNIYKCKSWKIVDITKLSVDVKYEFQSNNHELYSKALVLAEGKV